MPVFSYQRLLALDGLRFIAALCVAFAHAVALNLGVSQTGPHHYLTSAGLAMTLFFVLSGFVIHYHYHLLIIERGRVGILQFMWLRFSRLYPLYVAVIALDIITSHHFVQLASGDMNDWKALLPHVFMVQTWYYDIIRTNSMVYQFGLMPQVAWSISTEMFFYVVYIPLCFLLARVTRNKRNIWLLACAAYAIFFALYSIIAFKGGLIDTWAGTVYGPIANIKTGYQDSFIRWLIYFSPYARLLEFILGTLAASMFLLRGNKEPEAGFGTRVLFLLLSIAAVHGFLYSFSMPREGYPTTSIVYSPLVAILIYWMASRNNIFSRFLSKDLLVKFGQASYSIYLLHLPIISAMKQSLTSGSPADYAMQLLRITVALLIVLVVGRGVYLVFEIPAQNLLRARQKFLSKFMLPAIIVGICIFIAISSHSTLTPAVPGKGINVVSATYGKNCGGLEGNATQFLIGSCNGEEKCRYVVDVNVLGDPANGCGKDFDVKWLCSDSDELYNVYIKGEAGLGSIAEIVCHEK
jgi:peptidoglycan/LPS O-acetylase OafA/YrhL